MGMPHNPKGTIEATLKPKAPPISELEEDAQDVHKELGLELKVISILPSPNAFSDQLDDASGWIWGF
jgi:hypothetical protein